MTVSPVAVFFVLTGLTLIGLYFWALCLAAGKDKKFRG